MDIGLKIKFIENTRDVEYVLIFKSTDLRTSPQVKTNFYYLYFLSLRKDVDTGMAEVEAARNRQARLNSH